MREERRKTFVHDGDLFWGRKRMNECFGFEKLSYRFAIGNKLLGIVIFQKTKQAYFRERNNPRNSKYGVFSPRSGENLG